MTPKIIQWESLGSNNQAKVDFELLVSSKGYHVFLTGLNKKERYMDRVAIKKGLIVENNILF